MFVQMDTDLSDKQQYVQCHTELLMSFPIPSSHYGLTSADEINREMMLKLYFLGCLWGVCVYVNVLYLK